MRYEWLTNSQTRWNVADGSKVKWDVMTVKWNESGFRPLTGEIVQGKPDDQSNVGSRDPPNEHAPLSPLTSPLARSYFVIQASQQAELHHTPKRRSNAYSSGRKFKSRPDRVKFDKSARPHDRRHRRRHHRDVPHIKNPLCQLVYIWQTLALLLWFYIVIFYFWFGTKILLLW